MRILSGLTILAAAWLWTGHAAADATVRLAPEAALGADWVRLGDLGAVESASPEEAALVADVFLGPAPLAGAVRTVTRAEIVARLRERGLARLVRLAGADTTAVRRCEAPAPVVRKEDPARDAEASEPAMMEEARLRALVTELVRREALAAVERPDAEATVRILDVDPVPARGATGARLVRTNGRLPGRATVTLVLLDAGGRALAETEARVDAEATIPVVTLRRALRKGEPVRPADVVLEPAPWRERTRYLPPVTELFEGRVAARTLATGVPLKEGDLEQPSLVERNKPVRVSANAGGFEIQTIARALEEGRAGEVVTVENPETKRRYLARVVGFARVEAVIGE